MTCLRTPSALGKSKGKHKRLQLILTPLLVGIFFVLFPSQRRRLFLGICQAEIFTLNSAKDHSSSTVEAVEGLKQDML